MTLKIKLLTKQILGKVLSVYFGAKGILLKAGSHLLSSQNLPILLYRPPLEDVLLIHQGEPIDLLVSIKSSIILRSEEGHSVTFRRVGACLVIQSEGLEMESEQ